MTSVASTCKMIPIDSSRNQIRLLEIPPGSDPDDIHCTQKLICLDDKVEYQTLSYVWGERTEGRSIILEGCRVEVTDNLFSALHTIRSSTELTILWVDALCINQEDAVEKKEQVYLMRRIYTQCANCFIHLGRVNASETGASEDDSLEAAQAAMDAIHVVADSSPYSILPSSLGTPEAQARAGKAFQFVQGAPWWSRIWTIQESVAPPRHTLLWGPLSIPWEVFVKFSENAMALRWPDHLGLSFFVFFPQGIAHILSASFTALDMASSWARETPNPLDMLWRFRYRHSTDPRDKVYSILALLHEGERPLPSVASSDYELPAATLYKRVTIDLIRDDWGLRPLIGLRGEQKSVPGLPSWVVDWSLPKDGNISEFWAHEKFYMDFTADRGLPMLDKDMLTHGEEDSVIHLNGLMFDHVLVSSKPVKTNEIDEVMRIWNELTTKARAKGLRDDPATETYRDIVFKHMMEGSFLDSDRRSDWRKTMWSNQTLFFTKTGFIGLGPSTVTRGDEIWILSGGRVPFMLRPREGVRVQTEKNKTGDCYFVGDVHMPGLMYGEAVEGRLDEQRFVQIH
ncbi:HET-domain-containing protein [Hypoxylon rubiginosum]|uniref:HET-domain-containing protein n=1 Tax=Hypoxylon rubiginosum TaxID=110542 RepID=A0ACB9YKY4_9PEZI|nr:HET-domain-containing protein [Hypoxylon rubiginosum]